MSTANPKKHPLWQKITLTIVVLIVFFVAAAAAVFYPTFRSPPQASYRAATDRAEAHLQDIDYLRRVIAIDRSFSDEERDAFEAAVSDTAERVASLDRAQFEMELSRALALADNAHTNVRGAVWGLSLNSIPLRFGWFSEGLFVVSGAESYTELMGARVIAVEGAAPHEMADATIPYLGGPDNLARELSPNLISSPQALHAMGLAASPDELRLRLKLLSGSVVEHVVPAVDVPVNGPPTEDRELRVRRSIHWPRRNLSPVPSAVDPEGWTHLLAGKLLPLYLRHPDSFYWHTFLDDPATLYVQINATRNEVGEPPLPEYLATMLEEASTRGVRDAIVDLRFNAGGNYALAADFAERLPGVLAPDGRLYIVTSGNTWSAGLVTAARLKHFGGERSRIVGERVGDDEQFWAEGRGARFPNLGIRFDYSTAYHDWENGCSILQVFTCFFLNYQIGVAAGDLSPAIPAPVSFADYIAGIDTVVRSMQGHRAAAARLPGTAGQRPPLDWLGGNAAQATGPLAGVTPDGVEIRLDTEHQAAVRRTLF